jgi:alanyl-tRNA synthetase
MSTVSPSVSCFRPCRTLHGNRRDQAPLARLLREARATPSSPPPRCIYDDPNLLFVNAGMVPFKPYFLGQETPLYDRATSVQKCVRTGDIEEVGKTSRHGTFFQMNGNFSFGDYFKEGPITLAWELLTTSQAEGGYGLDADKLWPTVYEDDDEAFAIWVQARPASPPSGSCGAGWPTTTGRWASPAPCGPCSEIYYDRGPEYGREGGPAVDEDRYLEVWNLVFMQNISAVRAKDDFDISGTCCPRTSTPAWAWSGWRPAAGRRQPLRDRRGLPGHGQGGRADRQALRRHSGQPRGPATPTTSGCGSSPTTCAPRSCSSVTASPPATRAAAMSCAGCCAARCARCACSATRTRALPELLPVSMERMSKSYPELRTDFDRIARSRMPRRRPSGAPSPPGTTILDTAVARTQERAGWTTLAGRRPSRCTTPTASPSTSPWRWPPSRAWRSTEDGFPRLMQRAARPRQGRRQGQEVGARRTPGLPRDSPTHSALPSTSPATTRSSRGAASRGILRDGAAVAIGRHAGEQIELVLDRTPSTPRAAANWPTRA